MNTKYLLWGAAVTLAIVVIATAGFFFLRQGPANFASGTTLSIISGEVQVQQTGQLQYTVARDGQTLQAGDRIRTSGTGFGMVTFFDGSTTTLAPATEMSVSSMVYPRTGIGGASAIALQLLTGVAWTRVAPLPAASSRFQIDTPAAVILVRGTLLLTEVDDTGITTVRCFEGLSTVRALNQEVELTANTRLTVELGQPPKPATLQPPPNQRIVVHSSPQVWARLVEPGGRTAGFAAPGIQVNQLPESVVGITAGPERRFDVPITTSGEWDVIVEGGAEGEYQVVVQGLSEGNAVFTKAYRGTIRPGQRFSTKMNVTVQNGRLIGGQVGEFEIPARDAPYGKFVIMQSAVDGISGTATAVAIKGTPTPAVPRTATNTPLPTATPQATETPAPDVGATVAATATRPTGAATATPAPPTAGPASPTRPAVTATPVVSGSTATVAPPPPTATTAPPPPTATATVAPPTPTPTVRVAP